MRNRAITGILAELQAAAAAIEQGRPGQDFLVLENGDEMNGYLDTPLEERFAAAALKVQEAASQPAAQAAWRQPQIVAGLVAALLAARPAIDAYRSRMFRYATDWGSEISRCNGACRALADTIRSLAAGLSPAERTAAAALLPADIRGSRLTLYYWVGDDNHEAKTVCIGEWLEPGGENL